MEKRTANKTWQVWEIKVQGILDPQWAEWFNGMMVTNESDITTLVGPVIDQAALRGILDKIWDLNLTLISVNRIETNS
jgi:hypothetical protein